MSAIPMRRAVLSSVLATSLCAVVLGTGGPALASGRVIWRQLSSRPGGGNTAFAIAANPSGSAVYITGQSFSVKRSKAAMATIAYGPSGNRQWTARFFGGASQGVGVAVSPDGQTAFVIGSMDTQFDGTDWVVVAYDAATGARRWAVTYDGTQHQNDFPEALAVSPDGSTLYVSGSAWQGQGELLPTTIAYDAATGAARWVSWDPSAPSGGTRAIAASPDGSKVFIAAQYYSPVTGFPLTRVDAYAAATGGRLWHATLGTAPSGIAIAPDASRVFVSASSVIAFDASTGSRLWRAKVGGGSTGIAVAPGGAQVIVSGSASTSPGVVDDLLESYDASSGARLWKRVFGVRGHPFNAAEALGISPNGARAYVTGISCASQSCSDFTRNWLTVAYSLPDGIRQWTARFGPAGTDNRAFGIAVMPGAVVVTGDSFVTATETDRFATIAYAA